jgi:hypothetical protein
MQQIFDQALEFLQQGISAIFRFVQLIWTWSLGQTAKVLEVPWSAWPLWKQILLVVIIAAVIWFLFIAAKQLWMAGVRVLVAFAGLLGAVVVTLPSILIAGLIALGGLWVINNLNLPSTMTVFQGRNGDTGSANDINKQPGQTTGQSGNRTGEPAGSR